jgi:hypothetical protein
VAGSVSPLKNWSRLAKIADGHLRRQRAALNRALPQEVEDRLRDRAHGDLG